MNLNNKNIISYAPSANITTADDMKEYDENLNFEKFSKISVRDKNTFNLVKTMTLKDVSLVVDPTLLIKNYSKYEAIINVKSKYILVYGYKFSKSEIASIKKLKAKPDLNCIR